MGFRVVAKVMRESEEKLARRLILIAIAESASDDGIAWIDQDTIAFKARLSRTHAAERIKEMETEGVIEIRKAQRGRRRISVYRITLPGLDEPDYDRLPFTLDRPFTVSEVPTRSESDGVGSSESTVSEVPDFPPPSPSIEPSEEPSLEDLSAGQARQPSQEVAKRRPRNVVFDALVESTNANPADGGMIGKAAKSIRTAMDEDDTLRDLRQGYMAQNPHEDEVPREVIDDLIATEIRRRADLYRRLRPEWELTPTALAKHWNRIPTWAPNAGMRPRDIAQLRDEDFGVG